MEYNEVIDVFDRTYCYYRQKYVTMAGKYSHTVEHSYGNQTLMSHLEGRYAVAVFAGPEKTRFLSVDVDAGGKRAVRKVIDAFVEFGIPSNKIYVSLSGKKGYHVDLFFQPCMYNNKVKNLYNLMIWRTGLDPNKVEYLPTFKKSIKLPLGVHAKTGARCWYVDRETLEPIEDLEYIKQIEFIDSKIIYDAVKLWNKKHWNELYADMICNDTGHDQSIPRDIEFNTEYYESKRLKEKGTRHNTMIEIARDLRYYGANTPQIKKALTGFYYRQDPKLISSTEREVLLDINEIAQWAEESIPVRQYRPSPNANGKTITINKEEINGILTAPTSTSRRIALLLYAFCKMFGSAHMSYESIASTVGCSPATVKKSINALVKNRSISKMSGGCHYNGSRLVRKANTYFIPNVKTYGVPPEECLLTDEYSYKGFIRKDTFDDYYYEVLCGMCSIEYLSDYLTKPELRKCKERMMQLAGQSASDDTGGCT